MLFLIFTIFMLLLAIPSQQVNHPKNSMKMLPPEPIDEGNALRILETEYFKPKEYTSRDFPRLIEGLGQQIRRDLDQAHSLMTAHAEQVRRLQERMDRLDANI